LNEIKIGFIIFGMSEETTHNLPNDNLRRILARLDSIDTRLEKLEARAYDTKPIWENALKEIAEARVEMRDDFEKVHVEIEKVGSEVETGTRRVERKIDILNQNILDVRADQRELEERMNKIDSQPAQ
jgi:chromosome segregation ATPase